MVEFRGVTKLYPRAGGQRLEALVDLSFEIAPGELTVVAGPSGAGKSTLVRLAMGEERPSRGAVLVAGENLAGLGRHGLARVRRRLGVVSQEGRLLPDRTVFGNVAFVLRALGMRRREARARALAQHREAGLAGRLNALPRELAHAERQRLLLARALASVPSLLLADEPTAMLDGPTTDEILSLLRAAQARGMTVFVATHAPEVAARLGGRKLRLDAGRLREDG